MLCRSSRDKLLSAVLFSSECESRKQNSSRRKVGVAIRTINKQNKSLFGDLLETKSERIRRITKIEKNTNCDLPLVESKHDLTSERRWVERLSSSKPLDPKNILSNTNVDKVSLNICTQNTETDISIGVVNSDSSESPDMSAEHHAPVEGHTACLVSEKNVPKATLFKLPEIIVRNIPSFPLHNDKKLLSPDSHGSNILHFSHSEDVDNMSPTYPSVSKILNATMCEGSKVALARWRQKMIAELGQDGFLKYYKALLTKGSLFHTTIERFLTGLREEQLQLDQNVEGCWHSLSTVLPNIGNVYALESHVVHSRLKYRGVIDCVAQYRNKPVLIEWKKSDTQKSEIGKTYDAPLQLVAYLGAMNYDERYRFQVKGGLLVVAYSDGSPAHVFPLNAADRNRYWRLWLTRVQQYWQLPAESHSSTEKNIRQL